MTKSTISRLFIGSVLAVIAGLFLGFAALLAAIAAGAFVMDGPDVVGFEGSAFTWSMIGLGVLSVLAIVLGGIGGLVAWIGALIDTAQLEDKTWFILLLVLGLLSFGFVAMIAYVIAAPDSRRVAAEGRGPELHTGGARV